MAVVVTGASGHLGANLVRALLSQGRCVRALVHRDRRALAGLDLELCEGDVRDPATLRRAFRGAETVFHAAAHISILRDEWPLLEAVNVVGTRNVVQAARECGVGCLIHFSSVHALEQQPLDLPVNEARPLVTSRRYPLYDRSKAAGEMVVRDAVEAGLDAVILYPTGMIGPYDWGPSHFGEVLLYLAQRRLPALIQAGFDWVDVRDVVAGALRAEQVSPPGGRYLLSGHWVTLRELADMVEELSGEHAPRWRCPMGLARLAAPLASAYARLRGQRPLFTSVALHALRGNRRISHALASRELDYRPRPLRETLADTLRWFRETGALPQPPALTEAQ